MEHRKAEMFNSMQGDNSAQYNLPAYKGEQLENLKAKENTRGNRKVKLFPCLINSASFHEVVR
jgi:hypothetical protein